MSTAEDDLAARLDRIEARLDRLVTVLDQAEPLAAMTADAADEFVAGMQQRGIDVDDRVGRIAHLAEKATEPANLDRLTHLVERLEKLEPVIELAATFEDTTGMAFDIFDAQIARLQERGVNLDRRLERLGNLVEAATEPSNVDRLKLVIDRLEQLEPVIELAASFQSTTGMMFDMADAQVARMQAAGIDPEARFGQLLQLATRVTDPEFHVHLHTLLDAAPGLIAATKTGELFGRAVDEVACEGNAQPVKGIFGMMRALRDPNVQRAVGFFMAVARKVGERLPQLPART